MNTEHDDSVAVQDVPSSAAAFDDRAQEPAEKIGEPAGLPAGSIGITEDGEIAFPEGGFEAFENYDPAAQAEEAKKEEPGQEPAPAFYTPEEMATAFQDGSVDEARIRPEALPYYKEIMARVGQAAQSQQSTQQFQPQSPPLQEITIQTERGPVVLRPPQPPQITDFKAFMDGAKQLACTKLLGIPPDDFDDMDPLHAEARRIAGDQIRAFAQQQYVQDVQRYNAACGIVAERDRRRQEMGALNAEIAEELPGINDIEGAFYDRWRSKLTVAEAKRVDDAFAGGDLKTLRGVIKQMYSDYHKEKGTQPPGGAVPKGTAAPAAAVKPAAKTDPPPKLEGTSGTTKPAEEPGLVDASELGDMDIADQAAWFVKHGFVK